MSVSTSSSPSSTSNSSSNLNDQIKELEKPIKQAEQKIVEYEGKNEFQFQRWVKEKEQLRDEKLLLLRPVNLAPSTALGSISHTCTHTLVADSASRCTS